MFSLRPISWKKFEKFVLYVGCSYERKSGDHRVYGRSDLKRPVVFPEDKEIPIFIIRNNLRTLGISYSEYISILEKL
ncbi:type II toxin-antitoxin system HicA family toxin [Candidatus Wolfebacteria bacterium]|nr:type II toxin-antitoxin system HicA family toxin [Candidatus Wolfebacteria bacterium]